ncbi:unnamed protein product [Rhodiola kirilowii]
MKANGEKLAQDMVVSKVLRSLAPKFNYVVCSIMESNNLDTMTIDELHGSLLVNEQRMLPEHVLNVATRSSPRGRWRASYRGRGRGRGRGRSLYNRSTSECFKCHKLGHFQNEYCPEWEKDANFAESDETEEMVLMTYLSTSATEVVGDGDLGRREVERIDRRKKKIGEENYFIIVHRARNSIITEFRV